MYYEIPSNLGVLMYSSIKFSVKFSEILWYTIRNFQIMLLKVHINGLSYFTRETTILTSRLLRFNSSKYATTCFTILVAWFNLFVYYIAYYEIISLKYVIMFCITIPIKNACWINLLNFEKTMFSSAQGFSGRDENIVFVKS